MLLAQRILPSTDTRKDRGNCRVEVSRSPPDLSEKVSRILSKYFVYQGLHKRKKRRRVVERFFMFKAYQSLQESELKVNTLQKIIILRGASQSALHCTVRTVCNLLSPPW
jgi:hypothetical protein